MNNNTEQLIKELEETKSLINNFLAKRIETDATRMEFGYKEMFEREKIEKKLYNLFLNRIDPSDKEILVNLDNEIDRLSEYIFQKTGFYRTDNGLRKEDNFINQEDYEFKTHDTFSIKRTKDGYTYDKSKPFNEYFEWIQNEERKFCEKYKDELERLHNALTKKELIMHGQYKLKNEEDKDLLRYISIYLGYKDDEIKQMIDEEKNNKKEEESEKKLQI